MGPWIHAPLRSALQLFSVSAILFALDLTASTRAQCTVKPVRLLGRENGYQVGLNLSHLAPYAHHCVILDINLCCPQLFRIGSNLELYSWHYDILCLEAVLAEVSHMVHNEAYVGSKEWQGHGCQLI